MRYGLPAWLSGKESACVAGDLGLIPGLGRSPGEGHGSPLLRSCLENPTDGGVWKAAVQRIAHTESDTTEVTQQQQQQIQDVGGYCLGGVLSIHEDLKTAES